MFYFSRTCSLITFCLLFAGCDSGEGEDLLFRQGGFMDIEFGQTYQSVVDEVGPPSLVGIVDGSSRAWHLLVYLEGPYRGVKFHFEEIDFVSKEDSPLDLIQLIYPFAGTTPQGIGIGSSFQSLEQAYGTPVDSSGVTFGLRYYCIGDRQLHFSILADTVQFMSWAYHNPTNISRCQ